LRHDGFAQYRANAAAQPADVEQAQRASEQSAKRHSPSRQKPSGDHRGANHSISIALKPALDPTVVYLAHLRNKDSKLALLNLSRYAGSHIAVWIDQRRSTLSTSPPVI
jgi:hypothetical protein